MLRDTVAGHLDRKAQLHAYLSQCARGHGRLSAVQLKADRRVFDPTRQKYIWHRSAVIIGPVDIEPIER